MSIRYNQIKIRSNNKKKKQDKNKKKIFFFDYLFLKSFVDFYLEKKNLTIIIIIIKNIKEISKQHQGVKKMTKMKKKI